ncbi:unnamed protein product [Cochlearia groenlandica]
MSTELKQLIVVVEGTAALKPYWHSIFSDYLLKIIRTFCGKGLNRERNPACTVELSMVIFNSHGSHTCLVQRSGWTTDVDVFSHWLSSIQFLGGGFNDVATAEGLSEALMMFSAPSGKAQPSNDFKRHCILITASNPHRLPTHVSLPHLQIVEGDESGLLDAETVASHFPRYSVSLSVMCPQQRPKIRALYNAGNLNPQSEDLSVDQNPLILVLISENFGEASAGLIRYSSNLPQSTVAGQPHGNGPSPNMQFQDLLTALEASQSKNIKVWEGNLYTTRQEQPVLITGLEGFRRASASDSLAANWPSEMQMVNLLSHDFATNREYNDKPEFLVFHPTSPHGVLGQLQDKKLWAVIKLPSQTLLLTPHGKSSRLIGMLFPQDVTLLQPQPPNQQQQEQQQEQQEEEQLRLFQQQEQQEQQRNMQQQKRREEEEKEYEEYEQQQQNEQQQRNEQPHPQPEEIQQQLEELRAQHQCAQQ